MLNQRNRNMEKRIYISININIKYNSQISKATKDIAIKCMQTRCSMVW